MHKLLISLVALLGVAAPIEANEHPTYKGYELPPFTVLMSDGPFELRRYASHVVAEVSVAGDRVQAASRGFRVLAGFIFGDNTSQDKIAMTVPVAQEPIGTGLWTVRFMMPASFTLQSLPNPNDSRIRLVEKSAMKQVAVGFSGLRSDAILEEQERFLRQWAARQGLTILEGPFYYFYDGPATLPWNRRNEVAFTVE